MKNNVIILMVLLCLSACKTSYTATSPEAYAKMIAHHRMEYQQEFAKNADSPLDQTDFKHMNFYKADASYNCQCSVELTADAKPFDIKTYSGMTKEYIAYGIATCDIQGSPQQLTLYRSLRLMTMPMYKDYLFLPFMDSTNGSETYGGGRYIDLKISDINKGIVNIDFNKCYNPYCAYSDGYNCPVPPVENHLDIAIPAGEKMYKGPKKKRKAVQ